jgi:putative transposase
MAVDYPLTELCALLEVSRSGYYAWRKRPPSAHQLRDQALWLQIQLAHKRSRQTYGSPRITKELKKQSQSCGRHRVARLMRQKGLRGLQKPGFRPRTTDSVHNLPIAPNRLKTVRAQQTDEIWVADITYIGLSHSWVYLAVVMDLYSRKVVGWALGNHLKTSLAVESLQRALAQRRPGRRLIHHSDQGVQYASGEYQQILHSYQIQPSMNARGNCYDNATMEAFFSTLKTELIHRQDWKTQEELKMALFEYIEGFYNPVRLHSSLGYLSPEEFEATNSSSRNFPPRTAK